MAAGICTLGANNYEEYMIVQKKVLFCGTINMRARGDIYAFLLGIAGYNVLHPLVHAREDFDRV